MTRKDFFLGLILGLIVFSILFVGYAQGQEKTDSNYVWVKAGDIKNFFLLKLEEENKRHEQTILIIRTQIDMSGLFVDSVKVKK